MPDAGVIVFAGPSLPAKPGPHWREPLARVQLRPPAQRGDVLAAMADQPRTIVLLDGYYYAVPAVTHKELLYALDAGIRVIGAASMGALRAVELEAHGMIGVGRVFAAFRDGEIDGDDEVAVLHAPPETGYRPVTLALVEVRHAVRSLGGRVPASRIERFVRSVKALPFTERRADVVASLAGRELGEENARRLMHALAVRSAKEHDALEALELALRREPPRRRRARPATGYLSYFKECAVGRDDGPTLFHAWNIAQLFHPHAAELVRWMRARYLLYSAALHCGVEPQPSRVRTIARRLMRCHERGLARKPLPDPEYFEEARLHALAEAACSHFGTADKATRALAEKLGFDTSDPVAQLEEVLTNQPELLPSWWQVRGFSFTEALPAALEAAAEAEDLQRCFRVWSEGARIDQDDLLGIATDAWGCAPDEVVDEAARRGLFHAPGLSDGLREALELVAPGERLRQPVNGYVTKREAVAGAGLVYPLGLARGDASAYMTRKRARPPTSPSVPEDSLVIRV